MSRHGPMRGLDRRSAWTARPADALGAPGGPPASVHHRGPDRRGQLLRFDSDAPCAILQHDRRSPACRRARRSSASTSGPRPASSTGWAAPAASTSSTRRPGRRPCGRRWRPTRRRDRPVHRPDRDRTSASTSTRSPTGSASSATPTRTCGSTPTPAWSPPTRRWPSPPGDVNAGRDPSVVDVAYTNNVAGATTTTLFGIDANLSTARRPCPTGRAVPALTLVRQGGVDVPPGTPSPNTGQLFTVGAFGRTGVTAAGFDIAPERDGVRRRGRPVRQRRRPLRRSLLV